MIVHYNHDKPTNVYVVNSRLPIYRAYYGDGLGSNIMGLFARMAPKVAPFAKQAGMKAIDVIRDKGLGVVGDLAGKAFSAVKNKVVSLVRPKKKQPLPSTTVMPTQVSKIINEAVQQKLESLAATPINTQSSNIASLIAESGLGKSKRFSRKSKRK